MSLTFYFPPHPFHLSIRARLLSRICNNFLSFHERDLAVTLLLTRDFIWLFKVKWTQSWNTFVYTHFEVSEKELAIKKEEAATFKYTFTATQEWISVFWNFSLCQPLLGYIFISFMNILSIWILESLWGEMNIETMFLILQSRPDTDM